MSLLHMISKCSPASIMRFSADRTCLAKLEMNPRALTAPLPASWSALPSERRQYLLAKTNAFRSSMAKQGATLAEMAVPISQHLHPRWVRSFIDTAGPHA